MRNTAIGSCPASLTQQTRSSAFLPCAPAIASEPNSSFTPGVAAAARITPGISASRSAMSLKSPESNPTLVNLSRCSR